MFNAVRRKWISFIDSNDPGKRGIMSESGLMKPLKVERADVEKSGADELKPSEETDESKGKDTFDRRLESYNETKII